MSGDGSLLEDVCDFPGCDVLCVSLSFTEDTNVLVIFLSKTFGSKKDESYCANGTHCHELCMLGKSYFVFYLALFFWMTRSATVKPMCSMSSMQWISRRFLSNIEVTWTYLKRVENLASTVITRSDTDGY